MGRGRKIIDGNILNVMNLASNCNYFGVLQLIWGSHQFLKAQFYQAMRRVFLSTPDAIPIKLYFELC